MPGKTSTAWLVQRVVLAILLMVGFYALAAAAIGGLIWIPYAEFRYLNRVDFRIAVACLGSAVALAVALVPRRGTGRRRSTSSPRRRS